MQMLEIIKNCSLKHKNDFLPRLPILPFPPPTLPPLSLSACVQLLQWCGPTSLPADWTKQTLFQDGGRKEKGKQEDVREHEEKMAENGSFHCIYK